MRPKSHWVIRRRRGSAPEKCLSIVKRVLIAVSSWEIAWDQIIFHSAPGGQLELFTLTHWQKKELLLFWTPLLTGVTANAKRKSEVEVLLTVETRCAIFELSGVQF